MGVWIEISANLKILHSIFVTPFVGVWIEIVNIVFVLLLTGHSLRGSVDWNAVIVSDDKFCIRHSLRGSVDWNILAENVNYTHCMSLPSWECGLKLYQDFHSVRITRHSLRGSVDWNALHIQNNTHYLCHSLRGSVDWNCYKLFCNTVAYCHSLRGSVDWNFCHLTIISCAFRHSLRGSVDWNW